MCLTHVVKIPRRYNKSHYYEGWKVVKHHSVIFEHEYYNIDCFSGVYNQWSYIAIDNIINDRLSNNYKSGFHIFLKREDAEVWNALNRKIVKVFFSDVVAYGIQTSHGKQLPCIVAKNLYVFNPNKTEEENKMCLIRDTAKVIIKKLVEDKETFTAYDVTEEVRSKIPSLTVYHYKLRDFIHDELQLYVDDGLYNKEQDFNKHANGPFVYSPVPKITHSNVPVVNQGIGNVAPVFLPSMGDEVKQLLDDLCKNVTVAKKLSKKPNGQHFWNVRDKKGRFTKAL